MDTSKLIGYDGIFATRLRELMKRNKATQQDVAAAVGTTRQAISQYAEGSVQPNIEKLYKIADYFHVSADYMLGIADVTASDVDDKAINKMLGLSEKAIAALKAAPSASTVNLLLEQSRNVGGTVLELLQAVFANHEPRQFPRNVQPCGRNTHDARRTHCNGRDKGRAERKAVDACLCARKHCIDNVQRERQKGGYGGVTSPRHKRRRDNFELKFKTAAHMPRYEKHG